MAKPKPNAIQTRPDSQEDTAARIGGLQAQPGAGARGLNTSD
jgi:hypothetical protein